MKRITLTVVVTVLVLLAVPVIVLATGLVNMGATAEPGPVERSMAALAVNQSVAVRAPEKESPYAGDPGAIETGLKSYAAMCVRCHGGPGVEREPFAKGLNPHPPELDHAVEEFTAGELFWITRHGIRMTGMPAFGVTHSDDDLWKIVAFLEELPELTDEQMQQLKQAVGGSSGHGSHGNDRSGSEHSHSGH